MSYLRDGDFLVCTVFSRSTHIGDRRWPACVYRGQILGSGVFALYPHPANTRQFYCCHRRAMSHRAWARRDVGRRSRASEPRTAGRMIQALSVEETNRVSFTTSGRGTSSIVGGSNFCHGVCRVGRQCSFGRLLSAVLDDTSVVHFPSQFC